jgi:hypothetical protein
VQEEEEEEEEDIHCWATGWTIEVLGFGFRRELGIFLFTTSSRTGLDPTQAPIQWSPGALTVGVKRPVRKADLSPPSSAEVKDFVELYFHSLNKPSRRGAQLKKRTQTTLPLPYSGLQQSRSRILYSTNWRHSK